MTNKLMLYQRSLALTGVRPLPHADGHDLRRFFDEFVPGLAAGIDDGRVVVEDAVGEIGLSQVLPDVLDRIEFRRARGQQDRRDVVGYLELAGDVPAGTIHQHDGVRAGRDGSGDFVEMGLHGVGVGVRHHERRAGSPGRADGAEQVGVFVALILRLARPASGPRPLPHQAVLLAQAHFVLPPQLDGHFQGNVLYRRRQGAWEVFLKSSSTSVSCAGWRGRALMWENPRPLSNRDTERSW